MKCEKCGADISGDNTEMSPVCSGCAEPPSVKVDSSTTRKGIPFTQIIVKNLVASLVTGLIITSGVNIYGFVFKGQNGFAEAGNYLVATFLLQTPKSGIFYLLWALVLLVFFLRGVLRALYKESLRANQV